jgi:hypothetical protein
MSKKLTKLTVIIVFLFSVNLANACEVILKNGKVIEAESCWEENGRVNWAKHGATMSLEKGKVQEIIDKKYVKTEKKSYGEAVVVLKNGKMIHARNTWVEGDTVYCQTDKATYNYDKEEVASIGKASAIVPSKDEIISPKQNNSSSQPPAPLTREQEWAKQDCGDDCYSEQRKCWANCNRPYGSLPGETYKTVYRNTIRPCESICSDIAKKCSEKCRKKNY